MHRAQKLSEKYSGSIFGTGAENKCSLSSQLPGVELLLRLYHASFFGAHVLITEPQRVHDDIGKDVSLPSHHAITDIVPSQARQLTCQL